MDIYRNGEIIGFSNYKFSYNNNILEVINNTEFEVRVLGVKLFSIKSISKERYENDAERKQTKVINIANGDALKMIEEAKGYKTERINQAEGDASRFNLLLKEYKKYPDITKDRIYLERMGEVLSKVKDKTIIKDKIGRNDPCPLGCGIKYKKCGIDNRCKKISETN